MMKLSDRCCHAMGFLLLMALPNFIWAQDSAFKNSIVVAGNKPVTLRSFVQYHDKKLTHVISVGSPALINYSYDLRQGAIFQIWRGKFMDVSKMWVERGEDQLAAPLGKPLILSDAPVVAHFENSPSSWPDSAAFDDVTGHGYTLSKKRLPTFSYTINGIDVKDSIDIPENGSGLLRTITISNTAANTYCRIASGNSIEKNSRTNNYSIDGNSYSIVIDKKFKAEIISSGNQKILVVKYSGDPVTYSINW